MARYRFPVSMGGLQWDAAPDGGDEPNYPEVGFDLPGVTNRLWIKRTDLVKIEPPTPPLWSVAMISTAIEGEDEPVSMVFQHRPFRQASAWFRAGSSRAHSWGEVCSYGAPVLLTPVEVPVGLWAPVDLPWSSPSNAVAVSVDDGVGLQVGYSAEGFATLAPIVARKAARALWSAADEKDRLDRERQS